MTFNDLKEKLGSLETVQNAPKRERIFHLSHTDLDGYSCQLVAKRFFGETRCFNSGYGLEVGAKLALIESEMSKSSQRDNKLLLISDLNISREDCKQIERIREKMGESGHAIEVKLLDHHKSGEALSKEFDWYFLDNERSATKIVYDWCVDRAKESEAKNDQILAEYTACVNAYDLWLTDDRDRFEFGKALNRMIADSREVSEMMFGEENNSYRLAVLNDATGYIEGHRNIALDDDLLSIKKRYLKQGGSHDTIDNLAARFVVDLLVKNKEKFTVSYENFKGLLTYQIGNSSVLGNAFLTRCPDYDFFMDVNKFGAVSLRADGKIDVSAAAAKLFGGGGHANASGGKIQGFKEPHTYPQLLDRILPILGAK